MADDIAHWLERLGLGQYAQVFAENAVDLQDLRHLTDDDLTSLGLPLGHRRRVQSAVKALGDGSVAEQPSTPTAPDPIPAPEAERRQLTVMFCDLVGSTALASRLDPEDMRELLRAYQDACFGVIARYDGYVAKFMGDGVYAYFGYPRAHEDDAERAINAGLGIVEAVGNLEHDLNVRIGIATGTVAVGDIVGKGASEEANVVGEAPNLAARLQEIAEPNAVVIGEATHTLAGSMFETNDLGEHILKGFADPISAWAVVCPRRVETRFVAARGGRLTMLIGRDEEMDILLRRWQRAKAGEGQVVLVSGEPGIGKSRLVHAFLERVGDRPYVRILQCSPHHANSAMFPFVELTLLAIGLTQEDSNADKLEKLEAWIRLADQSPERVAPLIGPVLGIETSERYPPPDISSQRHKQLMLESFAERVTGLAAKNSLLILVEDVHWIDPTSLELVGILIEQARTLPNAMIVLTYRPEFEAPWVGQAHTTLLALARLGRNECTKIAAIVGGSATLPAETINQIAVRADGVPLFVEELTKAVLESSGESASESAIHVPTTLQDSLEARLDRLGPAREIAQIGAVIGRNFGYELLTRVSGLEEDDLQAWLGRLVASELVYQSGQPPDARYTFKHALVQDTAYGSLLRGRRRELHARIGTVLEEEFHEIAANQPDLLAHHFTEGELRDKGTHYWLRAGLAAFERSAIEEAIAHITKGLDVVDGLAVGANRNEQELELRAAYATVLKASRGGAHRDVEQAYLQAYELCKQVPGSERLGDILFGLASFYWTQTQFDKCRQTGRDLLRFARSDHERMSAHSVIGIANLWRGENKDSKEHFDQAIKLHNPTEGTADFPADVGWYARTHLGFVCLPLGYPELALRMSRESIDLARSLELPGFLSLGLINGSAVAAWISDCTTALAWSGECISICEDRGILHFEASARVHYGFAQAQVGKAREGISEIAEGIEIWQSMGYKFFLSGYRAMLAEAYLHAEIPEEAISVADSEIARAERIEERQFDSYLNWIKGNALLALNPRRPLEPESCFLKAIDIARSQSATFWELRATTSLARLWHNEGKTIEAYELLAPIFGWFTEGFDTADLKKARALLDELS